MRVVFLQRQPSPEPFRPPRTVQGPLRGSGRGLKRLRFSKGHPASPAITEQHEGSDADQGQGGGLGDGAYIQCRPGGGERRPRRSTNNVWGSPAPSRDAAVIAPRLQALLAGATPNAGSPTDDALGLTALGTSESPTVDPVHPSTLAAYQDHDGAARPGPERESSNLAARGRT
jgi:hypothetical protein